MPGLPQPETQPRKLPHPQAISAVGDIKVEFDDFDQVAEIAAKCLHQQGPFETSWELLPRRARKRLSYRVKRWLNTKVAEQMTAKLLSECDPEGEIISWMRSIACLAEAN